MLSCNPRYTSPRLLKIVLVKSGELNKCYGCFGVDNMVPHTCTCPDIRLRSFAGRNSLLGRFKCLPKHECGQLSVFFLIQWNAAISFLVFLSRRELARSRSLALYNYVGCVSVLGYIYVSSWYAITFIPLRNSEPVQGKTKPRDVVM